MVPVFPVIVQISNKAESIPGRSFRRIQGLPVIDFLLRRIKVEYTDQVAMAVSDLPEDDVFEEVARRNSVKLYRGNWQRCLTRLAGAMRFFQSEGFVRVLGINPLVDIVQMGELVCAHIEGGYEYSYNEHSQGLMQGTGCDVFSREFVDFLARQQLLPSQEETVAFYIRQNEDKFHVLRYGANQNGGSKSHVNLETEKDLEVINEIAANVPILDSAGIALYLEQHPVVARYNQETPPQEVGLDKFFLHPEKVGAILGQGMDQSYPISVELTLTNRCNLSCVYCSDQQLKARQGEHAELSEEVLYRLFDDLAEGGTQGVVIEGGGEPTIYKGFAEAVRHAKACGLAVGLITNGTVRLGAEVLAQLEWIRVSLDASTAEEYKALKGQDMFERVLANIAWYAQHCGTVGVGYVVTKTNISHIESLVLRLRDLGASYVQLRPVVDAPELAPIGVDLTYLRQFQGVKFAVILGGMSENAEKGNHSLPCWANSVTSIISGDGSVYLCGRLNIYPWVKPIGNINEQSYRDIWLGEERRRQYEMVQDGNFCRANCPQCRVSKFNQMVARLKDIKSKHFI